MSKHNMYSLKYKVTTSTCDGEIRPSTDELDGGRFWSIQEIREAIGKDVFTPNFESEFQRFFMKEKVAFMHFLYDFSIILPAV